MHKFLARLFLFVVINLLLYVSIAFIIDTPFVWSALTETIFERFNLFVLEMVIILICSSVEIER